MNEYAIDALLVNWAQWARGAAVSVGHAQGRYAAPEGRHAPDEDLAQLMECVLVRMKCRRRRLWRAVFYRYVARYGDEIAARAMSTRRRRETADTYRALVLRAYAWIDAATDL